MSDLAAFLLARIEEEQAWARGEFKWDTNVPSWALDMTPAMELHLEDECAAKRQIVDNATNVHTSGPEWDEALRILALPYADHPDFRDEWQA